MEFCYHILIGFQPTLTALNKLNNGIMWLNLIYFFMMMVASEVDKNAVLWASYVSWEPYCCEALDCWL